MGIPVVLLNCVLRGVDADGEETITIPDEQGLIAAVAVARSLRPHKLRCAEVKFMRKVLGLTQAKFAEEMDSAPETVSRWENGAQVLSDHSEIVLRLKVCTRLHKRAPGILFDPAVLADMHLIKAREASQNGPEPMVFCRISVLPKPEAPEPISIWKTERQRAA